MNKLIRKNKKFFLLSLNLGNFSLRPVDKGAAVELVVVKIRKIGSVTLSFSSFLSKEYSLNLGILNLLISTFIYFSKYKVNLK